MKKFIFPLHKVLKVRELEEKKVMKDVADAIKKHQQEKQQLLNLQIERDMAIEDIRKLRIKSVPASIMNLLTKSIDGYSAKVTEQRKNVLVADNFLAQQKQELLAVTKKKKIIQKLRESKFTKFQAKVQREEQKIIDEIAGIKTFLWKNAR